MDIEWAIHCGEVSLLQARPITTLMHADAGDEIVRTTQRRLRDALSAGRGPWVLHNLAETLPHPTPLTWGVIQRFMSGLGGLGRMYRQAGFQPSPIADHEGFLDCIAGRIYMDTARASEMLFQDFPFAYEIEELRRNPDASQTPPTLPRGSFLSRVKAGRRLRAVYAGLDRLSSDLERELREGVFKEIAAFVSQAKAQDLGPLSLDALRQRWLDQERQVLEVFGSQLLMPGMISGMALGDLRTFLQETLWTEDADALSGLLSSGGPPDRTVTADQELHEVGAGTRPLRTWLAEHGHRAAGEFDLAAPRWREQPEAAQEMADRLARGEQPLERHRRNAGQVALQVAAIRARLASADREELDGRVTQAQRYVVLREDSKDLLMLGYDLLRDLALEAGWRLGVGQDIFFLTREQFLESLRTGSVPDGVIERHKATFQAEALLALPSVIDAKAVDSLGKTPEARPVQGGHKAFAVSSGEACGPARILRSPTDASDLGRGYVLVCPSTDPSWTPLFVDAAGLVLECGGTLSHGAVVAREMGLPAVVLPDATRLFHEGQAIRVDGLRGWVGPATGPADQGSTPRAIDPDDTSIPRDLIPPPAGRKDRRAARLAATLAVVWAVFLVAFFALAQQWVRQPTLRALDRMLWPVVRSLGRPAVVAIVAVAVAVLTLLIQRFATDNRRLLEAKRRAKAIRREADPLPKGSPRHAALTRLAAEVQVRTLMASMVPIGLILGPMVLPFVWFTERIDPAARTAPAGSSVQVVARIDGNWAGPVRLDVPEPIAVDESTPPSRTLPPVRATLERLLALYCQPRTDPNGPWELQVAPGPDHEHAAADLRAFLAAGVPAQGLTWLIRTQDAATGRFTVTATAGGHRPVRVDVAFGDAYPPTKARTLGPDGSPVKEIQVVYPKPKHKPVFWQPLAVLAGRSQANWASSLAAIDIGWLWLYILVYVPALFLIRAILKVA